MNLDYDLIRELLEKVEAVTPRDEYYSEDERECYHLKQMIDGGLVEGWSRLDGRGEWGAEITDLTLKGHEFLEACRESKIWNAIKEAFRKEGVALTVDLVVAFAKQKAAELLKLHCDC